MEDISLSMPPLAQGRRRRWALGSLLFSSFYFAPLIVFYQQLDSVTQWLSCIAYAGFLLVYLRGVFAQTEKVLWSIAGIFLIAAISAKFNPAGLILFGFGHFMLGYHFRNKALYLTVTLGLVLQLAASIAFVADYAMFVWPTLFTSIGLLMFGVFEQKEEHHRQAQLQSAEQLQAMSTIAERERIGRDLHDLAGHSLSSIALKAELAAKLLDAQQIDKAKSEMSELALISRQLLRDIRHAVSDIKHRSIEQALDEAVMLLQKSNVNVSAHFDFKPLKKEQETQLVFIVKELTTNILKHSRADKVEIRFVISDGKIKLEFVDNGSPGKWHKGNGLEGIEQRLALYNGKLICDAQQGMKVTITMEYQQ